MTGGRYENLTVEYSPLHFLRAILYLNKLFELHVMVKKYYNYDIPEDDDDTVNIESEEELNDVYDDSSVNIESNEELYDDGAVFEELPPCVEPFKTDYCVVCLSE